eukprot:364290-Chlamydomonas_euryale.AAC.8
MPDDPMFGVVRDLYEGRGTNVCGMSLRSGTWSCNPNWDGGGLGRPEQMCRVCCRVEAWLVLAALALWCPTCCLRPARSRTRGPTWTRTAACCCSTTASKRLASTLCCLACRARSACCRRASGHARWACRSSGPSRLRPQRLRPNLGRFEWRRSADRAAQVGHGGGGGGQVKEGASGVGLRRGVRIGRHGSAPGQGWEGVGGAGRGSGDVLDATRQCCRPRWLPCTALLPPTLRMQPWALPHGQMGACSHQP